MDKSVELLVSLGAEEVKHPGGTLLSHLLRVTDRLREWGAREDVQQAGLLHALFAPDGSPDPMYSMLPVAERARVVAAAGPSAEALVYAYGAMDREYTYPRLTEEKDQWRDRFTGEVRTLEPEELRDLMEITAANEVDICSHNANFREMHGPELFELFRRTRTMLSDGAWQHCQTVLK